MIFALSRRRFHGGVILAIKLFGIAAFPTTTCGETNLTLEAAQQTAFLRNWDLLAAARGVDAAVAQKIVARQFPNPALSFSTTQINVDGTPNSTPAGNTFWDRNYQTIIAINQLFEIGGKRRNRQASAQAGIEGATATLLDARRTLDLAVARAYVAVVLAEENQRVLEKSAASLRQEAKIAEIRTRAGEISTSDQAQIEITADRFDLDAERARSASAQARVALETLLGEARPRGDCHLSDALDALSARPAPPDGGPQGMRRADVVAAEAAWQKAEADLRLQKSNRVPDPTFLAQYQHEPPDYPNSVGFGVSFPLPLWNRNEGNIAAAQAACEQVELAFHKTEAQAAADIAVARMAYDDAHKRWLSYHDQILAKSEKVRQSVAYAYEKGGASLLDLLSAERNDNDVRLGASQAAADLANAVAALQVACAQVQPKDLKK